MYIHSLKLKNFKGFSGESNIIFNKPDGETFGSGLNIFVGENNCGKSTVLQAIDFLRDGSKKSLDLLKFKDASGNQENDAEVELEFEGQVANTITNFAQDNKIKIFNAHIYECINLREYLKLKRTTLDQKAIQMWKQEDSLFLNVAGIDGSLKKIFETNFIWADTDPNSEMSFGASTLCGLLLKEIAEGHKDTKEFQKLQDSFNEVFNDDASELRKKLSEIEQQIEALVNQQFGTALIKFGFEPPNIQSFFKNTSVLVDDGVNVPVSEKGNGMQRAIALALLQVYAKIIAYDTEKAMTKPFYFFIDEPELCLHPKGQQKTFGSTFRNFKSQTSICHNTFAIFFEYTFFEKCWNSYFQKRRS